MKTKFLSLAGLLLFTILCYGQNTAYTGKFTVTGPNSSNAAVYTNELSITITRGTEAGISLHFRGGSRTEPDDYIDLSGTINGSMEGGRLDASGSVAAEMKDGPRVKHNQQGMTIIGTLNANKIEGKVYLGPINEGAFFDFTAASSELKPALTFPVGVSPKVFNQGWVFGASFTITDEDGNEIDLSDKVEWSGTASFNPAKGKTSHPLFNTIGANKIILTVTYENKIYKGEYPVTTVDVSKYAFVGCLAACPADSHGGPADPLSTVGPVMEGSPLVFIYGHPAARVGDAGVHAACSGANTFTIISGDDNVLIDGKAAALFQLSQTRHCGGMGHLLPASGQNSFAFNKDVTVSNNGAEKSDPKSLSTDDEVTTGPKGLVTFSNGPQTMITLFPSTALKVLENIPEQIRLLIKYGAMMADGNTVSEKKILIELKNLTVKPKGTKFYVVTDSLQSVINVYHGRVTVTDKTSGISNDVEAGYSYRYANNKAEIVALADSSGEKMQREMLATVDNKTIRINYSDITETEKAGKTDSFDLKTFVQQNYLYIGAGALLVVAIMILLVRKNRKRRQTP